MSASTEGQTAHHPHPSRKLSGGDWVKLIALLALQAIAAIVYQERRFAAVELKQATQEKTIESLQRANDERKADSISASTKLDAKIDTLGTTISKLNETVIRLDERLKAAPPTTARSP